MKNQLIIATLTVLALAATASAILPDHVTGHGVHHHGNPHAPVGFHPGLGYTAHHGTQQQQQQQPAQGNAGGNDGDTGSDADATGDTTPSGDGGDAVEDQGDGQPNTQLKEESSEAAAAMVHHKPPQGTLVQLNAEYNGTGEHLLRRNIKTSVALVASKTYAEEKAANNPYRARRDTYKNLPGRSSLLVPVNGTNGRARKLHKLCAARFNAMSLAFHKKFGEWPLVQSGWRRHPYDNSRKKYCDEMKKQYPDSTCSQAAKWKAFKSPHETGLAFDLGSPSPYYPSKAKAADQLATEYHTWFAAHMHLFGITPYVAEPWHWECVVPRENFNTGVEFTNDYNVRVEERSVKKGRLSTARNFY